MFTLTRAITILVVIHAATCYVKRDTAPQAADNNLKELAAQTETALTTLHSKFLEFVGVKDNNELVNLFQDRSKQYAKDLEVLVQQFSEEAKVQAGKADDVLQGLTSQVSSTIEELKAKNPEVAADAQKLKEKFEQTLREVVDKTEKLSTSLKSDGQQLSGNVEEVLKKIYENTKEVAQKIASDASTLKDKAN